MHRRPAPAGLAAATASAHLQPTFEAWRRYLAGTHADALFILGDLFEAWVGDDAAEVAGLEQECAAVLRATAARLPVFFMPATATSWWAAVRAATA